MQVEEIKPYGEGSGDKSVQVREMFDSIAPAYDFMNRAMTLGIDRLWRAKAVSLLKGRPHGEILDVATGTGDLAILMARKLDGARVTGVDLSDNMIGIARRKIAEAGLDGVIGVRQGDCLRLPFADGSFDAVTCAYGVRNFSDLEAGYREMHRVLRRGGTLMVLELSTPTSPIVKPLYRLYTRRIIPMAGRMVSRDDRAYSYLPESIAAVPQGGAMVSLMKRAGFGPATAIPLTFGVSTIYLAEKV